MNIKEQLKIMEAENLYIKRVLDQGDSLFIEFGKEYDYKGVKK